ncbi:MAG: ATP-dependent sacrificial sulfur transferase LarE [Candidatus Acidiferrales bacterium]
MSYVSLNLAAAPIALDVDLAALKERQLFEVLRPLESLLVAFSGGADSAYLAWAASRTLGDRSVAVTALSPSYSQHDRSVAESFVRNHAIRHEWIETHEGENPLYAANNADRCFYCKDELFARLEEMARERHVAAIAYGINSDDTRDFRPGHRAAREHRILAPLLEARLSKAEIRFLSERAALETWNRPASACLSSRVPYGRAVTPELLRQIERGEQALRDLGFRQFRVRAYGELARIEIDPAELPRALQSEMAGRLAASVEQAGFARVEIDAKGYRQGSLNEALRNESATRRT